MLALLWAAPCAAQPASAAQGGRVTVWDVPQIDMLPNDAQGRLVRFGRSIIMETQAHIGPAAPEGARYSGNNLACADCHLHAGVKKFGLPLVGANADFPAYSARIGADITLEERVNSCMTRSMNGRPMPADAPAMQALLAYLTTLSQNLPPDARIAGAGAGAMPELDRAADPAKGAQVFQAQCAKCHGPDGAGVKRNPEDMRFGYAVPPLFGPDSFNDGAGMARLITAANFVHSNMPAGTDWLMPILSVEESWDVAAFLVSQPRPARPGLARDFPDLLQKPVDAAYGPYADDFPQAQHKYGPFAPIRAALARLKAERGTVPNPNLSQ
ncbi:MAG: c-type cytochrome [Pseudomonadota bacterium]